MTSSVVYLDLKRVLPEDAWPAVIAALRQDPLVWEELQSTTFREAAVQRLGDSALAWSPVNLGLLALGSDLRAEALRGEQAFLPEELRERAARTARQSMDGEAVQPCLAKATLLALALWKGAADLAALPNSPLTNCALAGLFGLLPQPEKLLINLSVERALHALLSNPLNTETLLAHLLKRLQSAADEERLALLTALQAQRPQLVARLAEKAALAPAQNASRASAPHHPKGVTAALRLPLADLQSLLQQADLESASGDLADMQAALDKARRTTAHLQTALAIELAQASARGGNPGRALELWRQHRAHLQPTHSARIALTLIANGFNAEALELATTLEDTPSEETSVLLAQAFLAQQRGNLRAARLAAQAALAQRASTPSAILEDNQIAEILLRIDLVDEAIAVATDFARQHPNHPGIARLLTEAHLRAGQPEKALPWAHLAVALTPQDRAARARLAQTLEGTQNYAAALPERLKLIQHTESATPEERRLAANTALRAGRADIAAAICRQLISEAPQDGLVLTLLGQALLATGETDKGRDALERAVQFAPNHPDPWLALAEYHHKTGDFKRSLETLLRATRAGVESPRLLLALGKAQLENQAPTQALASLRRAVALLPSNQKADSTLAAECHHTLGQLLLDLGHNQEAAEVLTEACRGASTHASLHHSRALALWRLNRREEAFSAFERARELNPEDEGILLDYGRALLQEDIHDSRGAQTLHQLLEFNPQQGEAIALLARYYEHNDQPHIALDTYQHALGSELGNDPRWKKTLTLGLGRTALRLNQPETALAALESLDGADDDPATKRLLAEAYHANHLHEKALRVAQQAVAHQPGEREIVLWFCDLATEIGEFHAALTALDTALEEHPQATDLLLRRADLLRKLEQPQAAAKDFDRLATLENATPEELAHAAEGLLEVGDLARAATAFERAVALYKSTPAHPGESAPDDESPLGRLLPRLAETYMQLGDPQNALRTLEEAIQHAPQNTDLLAAKAAALFDIGQVEQAAHWLETQLKAFPTDAVLNYQAAVIQRARGAFTAAFEHAQSALSAYASRGTPHDEQRARLLAAQLACELLHPVAGRSLLAEGGLPAAQPAENPTEALLQCLRGELALEAGEEIEAAQALTAALAQQPAHPRTLALQARLRLRQGDGQAASDSLRQAFSAYDQLETPSSQDTLALAEAALECQAFDAAVHLLSTAPEPVSPRLHLMLARALTLRAEHQQLCRAVNIQRHAPGPAALAREAYRRFEEAILATNRALETADASTEKEHAAAQTAVSTWMARGQAAFRPSRQHAQALLDLPYSPDSQAAYLAALRLSDEGKSAAQHAAALLKAKTSSPPEHPYLLAQIALALAREAPKAALHASQQALDLAVKQGWPQYPVFIALKGSIAHRNAAHPIQLQAAQDLLTIWEDEPYWHLIAADLLLEQNSSESTSQISQAIQHLEKAIQIDPLNKASFRKLGNAYLKARNAEAATKTLQRALTVDKDDPAIWLALAQAQLQRGDLAAAAKSAHTAARLSEDPAEAYLLLSQTAMQNGDPEEAQRYANQVLRFNRGHPQALIALAEALQALDKSAEALAALETAAARSLPDTPLLLKIVALRRSVQGEKAAAKELEYLYERYPDDPRIGLALAESLGNLGQTGRAVHIAQKTLGNAGDLTEAEQARLHFVLGRLLRQSGQLDQAAQALSDAADIQPEWIEPYLELGRVYHERREYQRAIQTLQQAISIAPGEARAYHQAGLALKEIKDYPNAELMLRKAARLAPHDIRIHRQLGAVVALNLVHNKQNALIDSH